MAVDNKTLAKHFLRYRRENQKEEVPMSSDREKRPCEGCGQIKPLSSSYEKLVCASCMNVRGAAKLRPESVAKALREFHGPLVKWLTNDELGELKVSWGVGDELTMTDKADTQQPVGDHREIMAEVEKLREENKRLSEQLDDLKNTNINRAAENVRLTAMKKDILKSLQTTAVELEEAKQQLASVPSGNGIDKAKLSSLLADIGQGIIDGKKQISGRVFRELRKLAA